MKSGRVESIARADFRKFVLSFIHQKPLLVGGGPWYWGNFIFWGGGGMGMGRHLLLGGRSLWYEMKGVWDGDVQDAWGHLDASCCGVSTKVWRIQIHFLNCFSKPELESNFCTNFYLTANDHQVVSYGLFLICFSSSCTLVVGYYYDLIKLRTAVKHMLNETKYNFAKSSLSAKTRSDKNCIDKSNAKHHPQFECYSEK